MTAPLPSLATPNLGPRAGGALAANALAGGGPKTPQQARLWAQAQDFEVHFVNSMFQEMYTGIQGDGPFGNSMGAGPWRSFLTEEYAKNFVKSGGIGIAGPVYQSLLAHQEARAKQGS
jgi:Rod binding domain-containing protein